jgi:SAM-dependent methyltransferase
MPDSRTPIDHESHVTAQFGPQAQAYVASLTHAQGADLDALAALLAGRGVGRLLDLGCGGGHVSYVCAPHVGAVVAYDLSSQMLAAVAASAAERGLANISVRQGAAERLPFDDASFDVVVTRMSAHHWTDMPAGLAQAARVTKPGGQVVVIDTIAPDSPKADSFLQAVELLRDPSHVRDYRQAEWQAAARACGLRVLRATVRKLPLGFDAWIARMATPPNAAAAIRALQAAMPGEIQAQFQVGPDGSFAIDTLMLEMAR